VTLREAVEAAVEDATLLPVQRGAGGMSYKNYVPDTVIAISVPVWERVILALDSEESLRLAAGESASQ